MEDAPIYGANLKEFDLSDVPLPENGTVGNPHDVKCESCGIRIKNIESVRCQECDAEIFHNDPKTLSVLGFGPPRKDYWKERALKAELTIKNTLEFFKHQLP